MTKVILRQNCFGRWLIVKAADDELAWSGAKFVPFDAASGKPIDVQICNFEERQQAVNYCVRLNFEVVMQ